MAFTCPAPTHATLINGTNGVGRGTVIDNVNQLEWLDVDETTGLSPNQALIDNPGYRVATIADLQVLIDEFFTDNPPAPTSYILANNSTDSELISYAQTLAMTDLFGYHATDPGVVDSFYDDEANDGNQDTFNLSDIAATPLIYSYFRDLNGTPDGDMSFNFLGVWMVRNFPEPASMSLLLISGMSLLRRPSRKA